MPSSEALAVPVARTEVPHSYMYVLRARKPSPGASFFLTLRTSKAANIYAGTVPRRRCAAASINRCYRPFHARSVSLTDTFIHSTVRSSGSLFVTSFVDRVIHAVQDAALFRREILAAPTPEQPAISHAHATGMQLASNKYVCM